VPYKLWDDAIDQAQTISVANPIIKRVAAHNDANIFKLEE
jgi:hypothetical protein